MNSFNENNLFLDLGVLLIGAAALFILLWLAARSYIFFKSTREQSRFPLSPVGGSMGTSYLNKKKGTLIFSTLLSYMGILLIENIADSTLKLQPASLLVLFSVFSFIFALQYRYFGKST